MSMYIVWERHGVHEDPKDVFFSYDFLGPKFNVVYEINCSQAHIRVEQVLQLMFLGGGKPKIA